MHTTYLSNGWIAIHDGEVGDNSEIILRDPAKVLVGNDDDTVIPYLVFKEFVADQIRKSKISELENMSANDILGVSK